MPPGKRARIAAGGAFVNPPRPAARRSLRTLQPIALRLVLLQMPIGEEADPCYATLLLIVALLIIVAIALVSTGVINLQPQTPRHAVEVDVKPVDGRHDEPERPGAGGRRRRTHQVEVPSGHRRRTAQAQQRSSAAVPAAAASRRAMTLSLARTDAPRARRGARGRARRRGAGRRGGDPRRRGARASGRNRMRGGQRSDRPCRDGRDARRGRRRSARRGSTAATCG